LPDGGPVAIISLEVPGPYKAWIQRANNCFRDRGVQGREHWNQAHKSAKSRNEECANMTGPPKIGGQARSWSGQIWAKNSGTPDLFRTNSLEFGQRPDILSRQILDEVTRPLLFPDIFPIHESINVS
jgi:hypothetical protein